MSFRDILLTLLVIFVWGVNFVAIKVGVAEVPPLLFTGLRFFFTALPMVFFLPRPAASWAALAAFGILLGTVKFGLVFSAIRLGMPVGLTSLVMQLQVFFTIGLAVFLLGERPNRMQITGALIAFGGIGVLAAGQGGTVPMLPFAMTIAAAFAWGCANIVIKKVGRVDMLAFLVWSSLFSPLPLFALSFWLEGPDAMLASLSPPTIAAMLALAFIVGPSTLFAFGMWNSLLSRYPLSQVSPFALLVPVVGLLCGVFLLGEPFGLFAMIGSAIVFCGLIINVFGDALIRRLRAP